MTYREARTEAAARLRRAGIKEDRGESLLLLEAVLRRDHFADGNARGGTPSGEEISGCGTLEEEKSDHDDSGAEISGCAFREGNSGHSDLREEISGKSVPDVRTFYLLHQSEEMPHRQLEAYLELTDRRCTRFPLQYLTGICYFMGLPMEVNPSVLIPRQDTEILAEEALRLLRAELSGSAEQRMAGHPENQKSSEKSEERGRKGLKELKERNRKSPGLRVLDLCTGSGCLAVSLKAYCPELTVTGSDCSAAALEIAARNAAANGQEVEWIESDLFAGISGEYDMIVSNPPYIPHRVIDTLQPEVRFFEPRLALDGGEDGLVFYREIAAAAGAHLVPGGRILLEIGSDQGEAVSRLLASHSFSDIKVLPDLAGLDRVATGRREQYV